MPPKVSVNKVNRGVNQKKTIKKIERKSSQLVSFDEFFWVPKLLLQWVGVNISTLQFAEENFANGKWSAVGKFSMGSCFLGLIAKMALDFVNDKMDFLETSMMTLYCLYIMLAIIVQLKFQFGQNELTATMNNFGKSFPKTLDEQSDYEVKRWVRKLNLIMTMISVIQVTSIQCFNLISNAETFKILYNERRWHVDFIYPVWYPFDAKQIGVFEICYLHQIIACLFTIVSVFGFDLLICAWIGIILMHFDQLKRAFKKLNSTKVDKQGESTLI